MKKNILLWIIGAILITAGVSFASYLGDFLRAGIDPTGEAITLNDSMAFNTITINTAGPTDNVAVADINVVKVDTSSANVTIGGFVGGVDGQVMQVVVTDATNNTILENSEATGNQDAFLNSGADDTLTASYGGWTLVCDGSNWYEVDN